MADPFRNELEGAMARADRAEREAARLREELAVAKAPPTTPARSRQASPVLVSAVLVALVGAAGAAAFVVKARQLAPEAAVPAAWMTEGPVVGGVQALLSRDGLALAGLECAASAGTHDPNAFICRGHGSAEPLARAWGLTRLDANVALPSTGCGGALPRGLARSRLERFGHVGAAAVPHASPMVVKVLFAHADAEDVCFEIDYAAK